MFGQKGHPILYRSTRLQNQKIYLPVYGRRYSKATTPGIYNAIILRVETSVNTFGRGPVTLYKLEWSSSPTFWTGRRNGI